MATANIEDELVKALAEEIAREIDFGVMADMMIQAGWHKVMLDRFENNNHAIDVTYWVEEHTKFGHFKHGSTFVFEDEGDAINFSLRWS